MSTPPMWRRYLRFLGPDPDEDVEEEIQHHLEMRTRDYIARGMDPEQARQKAMQRFGSVEGVRRECLEADRAALQVRRRRERFGSVMQDVRYAVRVLRRSPGFTAVAVLTIGLGIGATTSIFSVLNGVLLSPLPYAAADRLVVPRSVSWKDPEGTWPVTYADFQDWRAEGVFSEVAVYWPQRVNILGEGDPERIDAISASEEFFPALGVAPVVGRTFRGGDFLAGAPRVVVISHGLWQRRFGGAPDVVGRSLRTVGSPAEIVGVLPRGAEFPSYGHAWFPLQIAPEQRPLHEERDNFAFQAIARLAPGKSLEATRAELSAMARRVELEAPAEREGVTVTAIPLSEWIVGEDLPRALWLFLGAVVLVLLIGCVNVANLMLSRAAARRREFAVRGALGAGRGRLVRQLLTESLVLSLAGGLLGVLLAYWGTRALVAGAPAELPRLDEIQMSAGVLLFATGVSALAALVFGLAPAWQASSGSRASGLAEGSLRTTGGVRGRRLRDLLVVAELALSLVLLVGAGLLLRSLSHLRDTDPGFETASLLTFGVALQGDRYEEDETVVRTFEEMLRRTRELPGVTSASASSTVPLGGGGFYLGRAFLAEGQAEPPAGEDVSAMWIVTSPGYFGTMEIPLLSGREFSARDDASSVPVMIVNREFARRMFPDGEAIGKRVRSWRDENLYREVVGVVDDVRFYGAGDEIRPLMYVPHAQSPWSSLSVAVRTAGEPTAAVAPLRAMLQEMDPTLAISDVQTMEQILAASVAPRRFGALLLSAFALIALVLATVGIYGVLSYVVAQRTREIGVRMALGAERKDVIRMVLREAAGVVVAGLAVGTLGAALLSRSIGPLLYEVSATDPTTFGMVALLLGGVALAASWVPARRATRVDPASAIRWE